MSTETAQRPRASLMQIERRILFGILAAIVGASLASAFTHMHDWTIHSVDEALVAIGSDKRTPHWIGWANAVISELLPVAAFLLIRDRQRQKRSATVPVWIFIGGAALSLAAQLSATGVEFPWAAQFLVCLPALSTIILSKVIFSDLGHAAEVAEAAAERMRIDAERTAERRRIDAEHAAELARNEAERAAELAAEHARKDAELAAELRRQEAERAAELERERRAAELAAAERLAEIEAAAVTERSRIEAAERAADRAAAERREQREADVRAAAAAEAARVAAEAEADRQRILAEAEARRVAAEAERVAAEAAAKRQAAAALAEREAQRPTGGSDDEVTERRRRMSAAEREALVAAVLAEQPNGTTREVAIAVVAQRLDISIRHARSQVPEGWIAGSSATGGGDVPRRLHLASAATA